MTDLTYQDLFAQSKDLRRKLARARSSTEAGELQAQLTATREMQLTIHMQLMELVGARLRERAS